MSLYFLRHQPFRDGIHRFGWNAVVSKLRKQLHNENSNTAFDDFLEFTVFSDRSITENVLPYDFPWFGVIHHPSNVTYPFDVRFGAPALFSNSRFRDSLGQCKGLFTLSRSLKRDAGVLLSKTDYKDLPIHALEYPTELNVKQFDIREFDRLPKVVCLGWWLRRMESLYKLRTAYPKFFMLGSSEWARGQYELMTQIYEDKRRLKINLPERDASVLPHLGNDAYDRFLASSIVFLDLIDTSANTAVIECIASATPVLVNPLDAVIEYLGEDYPFYYDSMEEASEKLNSRKLILETHEYLKSPILRERISYDRFLESFIKITS